MFLTHRQLARLALLMSNNGRWNGSQIVSASYVAAVSEPTPTNGCYGLLFWTNRGKPCTGADIPAAQTLQRHAVPSAPADHLRDERHRRPARDHDPQPAHRRW
ncbi:hypothetical protein [Streptomyces sp. KL116D]|uniref:hypothetical protein n=1 Tax=Streptomyces sp. KL116D TaxID=3045152 RepID=UPI003558B754